MQWHVLSFVCSPQNGSTPLGVLHNKREGHRVPKQKPAEMLTACDLAAVQQKRAQDVGNKPVL